MNHLIRNFERTELIAGYRHLISNFPDYVDLSRDTAENHAESYRNFDVGNVGLAMTPGSTEVITISAANYKMKHNHYDEPLELDGIDEDINFDEILNLHDDFNVPTDIPKVCAEMATILKAHELKDKHLFFIGHITTATTVQSEIEAVTGLKLPALPPCWPCVEVLDKSEHTGRATLYISAGLDENIFQIRNMPMLKQLYRKGVQKEQKVGRISIANTRRALELFDRRISSHIFTDGKPSHVISSFARNALLQTATVR